MDNNYRGVTPLKKRRNKITLNAAIVLCIIVFIIGILCGNAGTANRQNQEATKRIQEIEQEYEIDVTQLEKLNSDYVAELNKVKGELAEAQSKIAAMEKANEEAQAAAQEAEVYEKEAVEQEAEETAEETPKESGSLLKKIIVICLIVVIILCVLLGASIILKKNSEDDEYDEEDEEYDDFDDDIEYIEENYNDENE